MGGDVAEVSLRTGMIAFVVSMKEEVETSSLMATCQAIIGIITTRFALRIARIATF
jgi:hypothetical protein